MLKHTHSVPKAPQRVVVLGGTGFIGQELVKQLHAAKIETVSVSSKEVDLTQPESVEQLKGIIRQYDSVVFTSAITPDKGKDTATLLKNLTMAQNLAKFIEGAQFAHFIHISSDAVYSASEYLISEKTPLAPSDLYGYMHVGREMIVTGALQKAKIPFAVLRPCSVYGAADTHNSYGPNRFSRTAGKDAKINLFGQGEEKRDHVSVQDVARVILLTLSHHSEGTLNIASGTAVSFFDVAQKIAGLKGPSVEVVGSARANPITHRHFDTTALTHAFPTFRFVELELGLQALFN